jgi:hypothetical protein
MTDVLSGWTRATQDTLEQAAGAGLGEYSWASPANVIMITNKMTTAGTSCYVSLNGGSNTTTSWTSFTGSNWAINTGWTGGTTLNYNGAGGESSYPAGATATVIPSGSYVRVEIDCTADSGGEMEVYLGYNGNPKVLLGSITASGANQQFYGKAPTIPYNENGHVVLVPVGTTNMTFDNIDVETAYCENVQGRYDLRIMLNQAVLVEGIEVKDLTMYVPGAEVDVVTISGAWVPGGDAERLQGGNLVTTVT